MSQVKLGHHVVMSMQREQAFWWPWVSVPHIAPPTTRMFKEALMAMGAEGCCAECTAGRENCQRFSNYVEVIKEALREGYQDFCGWAMPNWSQQKSELTDRLVEGKLELCLAVALDDHLLPLLAAQGLTYNVHVVRKGEDRHAITVYAERETCCGLQLIWAVAIQTKIVLVESLEQLAGLAVAKALGDRGEKGLMALDCAGRQKEVVRQLMDKKEEGKQEKEEGKQEKGCKLLGKVKSVEGLQLSVRDVSPEEEHLEDLVETLLVDLMELVVKE